MNIVLIGAQGSGKGTQAKLLTQILQFSHVASGDLFRKALDEQTELGLRAKTYLEHGELVPDELTVAMVLECINLIDCCAGLLLDGFPRTIAQARLLDQHFTQMNRHIDLAIYLDVPSHELISRITGRLICHAQQHVYHAIKHPPKTPGICDIDGSELYQRTDDQDEAIKKRLEIFFRKTVYVLEYYKQQQKLVIINGDLDVQCVFANLFQFVKKLDSSYLFHNKEQRHFRAL